MAKNFQVDNSDAFSHIPDEELYIFPSDSEDAAFGGSVRIVDSTTFKVSTKIAAAEVTVEPGAIRYRTYIQLDINLETLARYVPTAMGHYVENTGNATLRFLELFNTDRFQDISLNQWLALTPPHLVKAHLQLDDETIAGLSKKKPVVVGLIRH
ncbi:RmlC-like cupin [Hymenopellis radicata]|nr:RmlC-like cupin [Hymenopellis radicata]